MVFVSQVNIIKRRGMDLSREFIQYQLDNPHNVSFKNIISHEDREDTLEGFKRILSILELQPNIKVNDTVYVVTKYGYGNEEVIECRVTRMTYIRKFSFSVKGRYANGNFYNANFTEKSIGKNVFLDRDEAEKKLRFKG